MRLVEEEDQLRLVDVAHLGQRRVELRQQPHQERREQLGSTQLAAHLEQADDAAGHAIRCRLGAEEVGRIDLGQTEEHVSTLLGERDQLAQDDARCGLRQPAEVLQLRLARGAGEVLQHGAQIVEGHERQLLFPRVVEDEAETRLLGRVEAEHLAEHARRRIPRRSHGSGCRCRRRRARRRRSATRAAPSPGRGRWCGRAVSRSTPRGSRCPHRSPLMSAANTGTPAALSCSASTCRVFVLPVPVAPATSPWRLTMASGMRIGTSASASPFTSAPISSAGASKA